MLTGCGESATESAAGQGADAGRIARDGALPDVGPADAGRFDGGGADGGPLDGGPLDGGPLDGAPDAADDAAPVDGFADAAPVDAATVPADGAIDATSLDLCPDDPGKTAPGVCGCGVADDDGDGDGALDCEDACPADAAKTAPGVCGCGVADGDGDGDGALDCEDGCPADAAKIAPGVCGCGVADDDGDGDGALDCEDGCPADAAKTAPGVCGCGVADDDGDGDGALDCDDGCPADAAKIAPGACGCGALDADDDQDGVADCVDGCPADPAKAEPGPCGCGVPDADGDGDGAPDCLDACPEDADRVVVGCGCGAAFPEVDTDGDLTPDCIDACPEDAGRIRVGCGCGAPGEDVDTDADETPDCVDGCPDDALKVEPGVCGCGVADADADADETPDCVDGCPDDPLKVAPGLCGCGVLDVDSDFDGTPDCRDACPADPTQTAPGVCGCGWLDVDPGEPVLCAFAPTLVPVGLSTVAVDDARGRLLVAADAFAHSLGAMAAVDLGAPEAVQRGWPRVSGSVAHAIADGEGGFYVAGTFDAIDGVPRPGLARLHADGSLDLGFEPAPLPSRNAVEPYVSNSSISTLAAGDGALYVLGTFAGPDDSEQHLIALDAASGERLPFAVDDPTEACPGVADSTKGLEVDGGWLAWSNNSTGRPSKLCVLDAQTGAVIDVGLDLAAVFGGATVRPVDTAVADGILYALLEVFGDGGGRRVLAWSLETRALRFLTPPFEAQSVDVGGAAWIAVSGGIVAVTFANRIFSRGHEIRWLDAATGEALTLGDEPRPPTVLPGVPIDSFEHDGDLWILSSRVGPDDDQRYCRAGFADAGLVCHDLPLVPDGDARFTVSGQTLVAYTPDAAKLALPLRRASRLAAYDLASGGLVEAGPFPADRFDPAGFLEVINHIEVGADAVYVRGARSFLIGDQVDQPYIGALDPATLAPLAGFVPPQVVDPAAELRQHAWATADVFSPGEGVIYLADGSLRGFWQVNGQPRGRLAQLDARTGALTPWAPMVDHPIDCGCRDRYGFICDSCAENRFTAVVARGPDVFVAGADLPDQETCVSIVDATTGAARPWGPAEALRDCATLNRDRQLASAPRGIVDANDWSPGRVTLRDAEDRSTLGPALELSSPAWVTRRVPDPDDPDAPPQIVRVVNESTGGRVKALAVVGDSLFIGGRFDAVRLPGSDPEAPPRARRGLVEVDAGTFALRPTDYDPAVRAHVGHVSASARFVAVIHVPGGASRLWFSPWGALVRRPDGPPAAGGP